ncbi:MAG: lactate utilization protein [Chlorobi bacterium]|nr:lactate utilization protein [Chlorobiota bacterium]
MSHQKEKFLKKSKIAFDPKHRKTIEHNISKYDAAAVEGKNRYLDFELAKQRASFLKEKAINNLGGYLEEFETNITARGAEVLWARDAEEAIRHVKKILTGMEVNFLVKSKSMTTEEIEFNENIEKLGIESVETDLGEFIVKEAGEKPYHILTPAMHKSKQDIAELFNKKFNTPVDLSAEDLTLFVRKKLRQKFTSAQVGVTGANFIVADVGGIGLTENEGNGLMTIAFPKVHIVLAGIEKVIPSVKDIPLFLPLLAATGTGQQISVYNSLLLGPGNREEIDGPGRMVVILLDNGRSDLLNEKEQSLALKCIRCGACLNTCPIYKNIGGHTYDTTYSGPIGSVITPFYKGFKDFGHLSFASTLCGKCSEVCPVKIPLHYLLLLNRKKSVEGKKVRTVWDYGMKAYQYAFSKRKRLDAVNGAVKNLAIKICGYPLGKEKDMPGFSRQSFSKQWGKEVV